jgi:AhpD family alkylhydroperoxidase
MVEDWSALIQNMNGAVRDLRQAAPEVMKTFADMARAAHGGKALDNKTKELVALSISVAIRCTPCIAYHAEAAIRQGASGAEVAETLAMAIYMGAGPSVMYAAQALEAVDQLAPKSSGGEMMGKASVHASGGGSANA